MSMPSFVTTQEFSPQACGFLSLTASPISIGTMGMGMARV